MENWKGTKCEPGYIQKQKKFQSLMLLFYIAVGVGLFLTGFFITGTRANVFTILGILMVLPGAKRVIALVVMLPHQSVSRERYDKLQALLSAEAVILSDYVFTSPDKIMSLDFVIIENGYVFGIWNGKKQDVDYMLTYLEKGVQGICPEYQVKLFDSEEELMPFYEKLAVDRQNEGQQTAGQQTVQDEELVEYLKILAV